jgi:hypothetical protein
MVFFTFFEAHKKTNLKKHIKVIPMNPQISKLVLRPLLFIFLFCGRNLTVCGQHDGNGNTIPIDFQDSVGLIWDTGVDIAKPLTLQVLNPDKIEYKLSATCFGLNWKRDTAITLDAEGKILLPALKSIFGTKLSVLQIEFKAMRSACKTDTFVFELTIRSNGDVVSNISGPTLVCGKGPENVPATTGTPLTFLEESWKKSAGIAQFSDGSTQKDCRKQLVFYYPCCNLIKILRYDNSNNKYVKGTNLEYYDDWELDNGYGIEFFIANYNVTKYTTSVSTSFINNFTNTPALITGFQGIITGGAAGGAKIAGFVSQDPELRMKITLSKLMQLSQDLKLFLSADCINCTGDPVSDCTNFDSEKEIILSNIKTQFSSGDPVAEYASEKRLYFTHTKMKNTDFNNLFQANYLVSQNPDTLVSHIQSLISALQTTYFFSQYNVPQVQNADKIQFTVNLQPTQGTIGSLNVPNQTIAVPIHGGIKMDWSTGVYYSNRKNENYALVQVPANNDSLQITKEKNFSNGTAGIVALLHMYPRWWTGFNVGLTLGVGVSPDQNYSGMAGLCLMIGRDYRMAISGGLNIANIKALSQSQSLNQIISPTGSVSTYNTFKTGFFLSLTYSFSVSQSTQSAAPNSPSGGGGPSSNPSGGGGGGGKGGGGQGGKGGNPSASN